MQSHTASRDNHNNLRQMELQLDNLLILQETYWKQRSRAKWLKGGDRNTKFFHHKASTCRRNNRIQGVQSPDNGWITNEAEVSTMFISYYSQLFNTSTPTQNCIDSALVGVTGVISDETRIQLDMAYSKEEIHDALFGMAPWKHQDPMDFMLDFFKLIGKDFLGQNISDVCLHIFNDDISIGDLNSTYLVLISQTKTPKLVFEYRPISL